MTATPSATSSETASTPPDVVRVAARVVNLRKVYGKGEAEVRALDGVTRRLRTPVSSPPIMGPSGFGQVDADALHAPALDSTDVGPGLHRRRRDLGGSTTRR